MARIRTIKPEFWTDEKIVTLPFEARLLFVGLWNFADDEGLLWNEPDRLRMQIFPSDPDVNVRELISLLVGQDLVGIYQGEGRSILTVTHFKDHQRIDRPSKSRLRAEANRLRYCNSDTLRALAKKYNCPPGGSTGVECYYCGTPGIMSWAKRRDGAPTAASIHVTLSIDHLEPVSEGGTADADNLVIACEPCNYQKNNRNLFRFMQRRFAEGSRELDEHSPTEAPPRRVLAAASSTEGKGRERKGREKRAGARFEYAPEFEAVWRKYGRHGDKAAASVAYKRLQLTLEEHEQLLRAIPNYLADCRRKDRAVKNCSTFLNSDWREWIESTGSKGFIREEDLIRA